MKALNYFSLLLIIVSFFSCGKEATFAEKFQGDWRMTTTGDLVGSYNFTVRSTPSTYEVTPYRLTGDGIISTDFRCIITVQEDGRFTIKLDSNVLTSRGTFNGTLEEMGTGSGNYTVVAWDVASFSELPLMGTFTLEKS